MLASKTRIDEERKEDKEEKVKHGQLAVEAKEKKKQKNSLSFRIRTILHIKRINPTRTLTIYCNTIISLSLINSNFTASSNIMKLLF